MISAQEDTSFSDVVVPSEEEIDAVAKAADQKMAEGDPDQALKMYANHARLKRLSVTVQSRNQSRTPSLAGSQAPQLPHSRHPSLGDEVLTEEGEEDQAAEEEESA